MRFRPQAMALLLSCLAPVLDTQSALADVVWDEDVDGDLSNDRLVPTSIPLAAGTNSVVAEMPLFDLDYFTVVVPENHEFSQLVLESYVGDDSLSFIGVVRGSTMQVPPNTPSAAGLLGWAHFGESSGDIGKDFLPNIGQSGFGAEGFVPPLPSGEYTFWIQQLDGLLVTLQLDFLVTELPGGGLVGDYSGNGTVDAADYNIWRDTLGATGPGLAADGDPNEVIDAEDYNVWKDNFGQSLTLGTGSAVPEPSTLSLTGGLLAGALGVFRRTAKRICADSVIWLG